jgi:hypothetical protein
MIDETSKQLCSEHDFNDLLRQCFTISSCPSMVSVRQHLNCAVTISHIKNDTVTERENEIATLMIRKRDLKPRLKHNDWQARYRDW